MSDLDFRARDLIDAARADAPSLADRRRIRHKIAARLLTLGMAGSSATVATAAGTMSAGAKIGLTVVAVLVAGGGTMGVIKLHSPETLHRRVSVRPAAVAVAKATAISKREGMGPPIATAADETGLAQDGLLRPPAQLGTARPVPTGRALATVKSSSRGERRQEQGQQQTEAPPIPADPLNVEVAVLNRAREQLRLGRPGQALEALAQYDRQFGKGVLAEERQAMVAIATCQAQPGSAAQARAESFLRSSPDSPLLGRVREACAMSSARGQH